MRARSLDSVVSRIVHDGWLLKPELDGKGFWWDRLDPEFWAQREPFFLEIRDSVKISSTAAADVAIRTFGACMIAGLALPQSFTSRQLKAAREDRPLYVSIAESGDATRMFAPPPATAPAFERRPARFPLFRPRGGVCEDVKFESPFVPVSGLQRERYRAHRVNAVAHARHWRHNGDKLRSTVIAVHGFNADVYQLNEWIFSIPALFEAGYDVLLVTLPFHGQRQEKSSRFSGHGFFGGGLSVINESFAQAVCDIRIFLNDLLARGAPQVGVMGISLGGLTSALLASVEPRLAFAIPNVPVASLADLMMQWEPIGFALRTMMALSGETVIDLRRFLGATTPLSYKPVIDREKLLIIGGVGDRLVPPKHSRLLWDHWDRCRVHWFPGSHLIHLDRGEYLREIRRFFGDIEFRP